MKTYGTFNNDGFKASIESQRFNRLLEHDITSALCSIIGTNPVFIKGGVITENSGNTTITDGIIMREQKLYHFIGGTYAGTPTTLEVVFTEATANGFPQPYFVGNPVPQNIYLDRTAKVETTVPSDSITETLDNIGTIHDLQSLKPILDDFNSKADKNGYEDITDQLSYATGFTKFSLIGRKYHDGTIMIQGTFGYSGTKSKGTIFLNGNPDPGNPAFVDVFVYESTGVNNNNTAKVSVQNDGIAVLSGFTSTYVGCFFNISYKEY